MLKSVFEALARADAGAALSAARAALAAEPQRAEAHHALGLALQMSGDVPAAKQALERAIALAPDRAALHVSRARLALNEGDAAAAQDALGDALRANPNALEAYLLALHLALSRGDYADAERQLALAKRVNAEHPRVFAAEGALALVQSDAPRALRELTHAAKLLPNDPQVMASLGLAYRLADNHAFAEAALTRAIELQPDAIGLRWALIDSLGRQQRDVDAISALKTLMTLTPQDPRALSLLGDLHMRQRELEPALDAYRRVLLQRPLKLVLLDHLLANLVRADLREHAVELIEVLLAAMPDEAVLWQRRLQATAGDVAAMRAVMARWQAALADDPRMLATLAEFEEQLGDGERAVVLAREVLTRLPTALGSEAILLRAEVRSDPAAALLRIARLLPGDQAPMWQRALRFWRAQALDGLGQCEQALAAWAEVWSNTQGGFDLPPPASAARAADSTHDSGPAPRLLWSPPGGRPREVIGLLASVPGLQVIEDRFGDAPRTDGFGPLLPDGSTLGRAGWRGQIEARGLDPARSIDWLPHWDARMAAALPGAKLVAVLADPRDLVLNWMAFASPFPLRFGGVQIAANWLRELLTPLVERIEADDPDLIVVLDRELVDAPSDVAQRLQLALALDALPDATRPAQLRHGLGNLPVSFPPGHWRHYQPLLAQAFDSLAPLAERLGYTRA